MPGEPEKDLDEASIARIVKELDHLKGGLRLLGVKQCSHCGKYFRCLDGRALFDGGQLVCYDCVQDWWQQRAPSLGVEERRPVEYQLQRWLVTNHNAKVIRQSEKAPEAGETELKAVVACEQCDGTGKITNGGKCRSCAGWGTVWVVVLRPELQ